ncbi:MAG: DNA repair protein RadC [Sphingomonadaceae bacterium]|nr:DNA repair protein RadC [Sphingomonadaceae bacterium]
MSYPQLFAEPVPRRARSAHESAPASDLAQGHRERMRQRMLEGGGEAFLDYELLEYILALAIPRRDVKPLAKRLIARFGSYAATISADPSALDAFKGEAPGNEARLTEGSIAALKFVHASALRLLREGAVRRDVIAGWDALIQYLHAAQAHVLREQFRVLFLNARNYVLDDRVLGEGTIDQAPVYTREIVKRALDIGATALILVHNHPSGDPTPSAADIALTRDIANVGKALGLHVHDHVIIGRTGHASLRALGLF